MSEASQMMKLNGFICISEIVDSKEGLCKDVYVGIDAIAEFGDEYVVVHNRRCISCTQGIGAIAGQIYRQQQLINQKAGE